MRTGCQRLGHGYNLGAVNHVIDVVPDDRHFEHGSFECGLKFGLIVLRRVEGEASGTGRGVGILTDKGLPFTSSPRIWCVNQAFASRHDI